MSTMLTMDGLTLTFDTHNPMRQAVLSKNKKIIEMLKQAGG